ncbi:MAG TPA: macrolide ABC transporter ATP-binding protein [Clostridiales bacterium]|nr:MAG: macrolide ABC transporter ATP-binding protein [Clostridiales bacterium GWD2_32_19]HCC07045.1 macrolide ABC transporter ATP-binding protein [Clostridiales bacterium]
MATVIEGKNIIKEFTLGGTTSRILDHINVNVNEGEFVSIMGPSGSGKSTLLYLLGGLDKPTSGEILLKGRDISIMNDEEKSIMRRRDIGFVFQFYNLIPNLNVEENILLPVLLDGKSAKEFENELNEILHIVGLNERRKHTPRELSGGQQQRVAIARALINSPDVILADEPIGNLDSKTGKEIMELFKKINMEKKKTIIQVTHSEEAAKYGNRVIQLMDGRVI